MFDNILGIFREFYFDKINSWNSETKITNCIYIFPYVSYGIYINNIIFKYLLDVHRRLWIESGNHFQTPPYLHAQISLFVSNSGIFAAVPMNFRIAAETTLTVYINDKPVRGLKQFEAGYLTCRRTRDANNREK